MKKWFLKKSLQNTYDDYNMVIVYLLVSIWICYELHWLKHSVKLIDTVVQELRATNILERYSGIQTYYYRVISFLFVLCICQPWFSACPWKIIMIGIMIWNIITKHTFCAALFCETQFFNCVMQFSLLA